MATFTIGDFFISNAHYQMYHDLLNAGRPAGSDTVKLAKIFIEEKASECDSEYEKYELLTWELENMYLETYESRNEEYIPLYALDFSFDVWTLVFF